jgi:hypothetical protein
VRLLEARNLVGVVLVALEAVVMTEVKNELNTALKADVPIATAMSEAHVKTILVLVNESCEVLERNSSPKTVVILSHRISVPKPALPLVDTAAVSDPRALDAGTNKGTKSRSKGFGVIMVTIRLRKLRLQGISISCRGTARRRSSSRLFQKARMEPQLDCVAQQQIGACLRWQMWPNEKLSLRVRLRGHKPLAQTSAIVGSEKLEPCLSV